MIQRASFMALMLLWGQGQAGGQLAITEVMSSASTNLGPQVLSPLSDFWELTNFDATDVDLTGYLWRDGSGGLEQADSAPFDGLVIEAGESIIFVQSNLTTMAMSQQFRDWWGANLPAQLKIILYDGAGKGINSAVGDSVRLWPPSALTDEDVIDRWDVGPAERGRTFTYDWETGEIVTSQLGQEETFQAAARDDLGSPGYAPRAVPAGILVQPASLFTCVGFDATFTVLAGGIPRPRFQWFRNGAAIAGATAASLIISNAQPFDTATDRVMVSNSLAAAWSLEAHLGLETNASAPVVLESPRDSSIVVGDTAIFSSVVCGFPVPSFQWRAGATSIPGETNRSLVLHNCQLSQSGMSYCLRIQNNQGSTSICARLTVTPRPRLEITEIMSSVTSACPGIDQEDWFEVTNADTFEVNLLGYLFASSVTDFLDPRRMFVVTNDLLLRPGRSAVFVRHMDRAAFVRWWGADALPPGLPVLTFSQFGLNDEADELYCWSPGEQDKYSPISSRSYASGVAGVSKYFDAEFWWGPESVPGENGAFQAAFCGDVGSPGYTSNPNPRLVWIFRDAAGAVTLKWRAVIGRTYQLKSKGQFTQPGWDLLGTHTATNWVNAAMDSTAGGQGQRFYKIEEAP